MSAEVIQAARSAVEAATSVEDRGEAMWQWCSVCASAGAVDELPIATDALAAFVLEHHNDHLARWVELFSGMCCTLRKDYDDALEHLTSVLPKFRAVDDHVGTVRTLMNIGRAHMFSGRLDIAQTVLNEVFDLSLEKQDIESFLRVLGNIESCYQRRGAYAEFAEHLQRWIEIYRHNGNNNILMRLLSNAGMVIMIHLSRITEALSYFEEAIALARQLGDIRVCAFTLDMLGSAHWYLGDAGRSIEYYTQSIDAAEQVDDADFLSMRLQNAAYPYMLLDDYQKVLELSLRAKALQVSINKEKETGWAELGIGTALLHLHDLDAAVEHLLRSIDLISAGFDPHGLGYAYFRLGEAQVQLQQHEAAYESFNRSLENRRHSNAALEVAETQCERAKLLLHFGDHAEAEEVLNNALSLAESIQAKAILHAVHKAFAELHAARENFEDAYYHLQRHIVLRDEVQSQESTRKVASLEYMHRHELQRKEQQVILDVLHKTLPVSIADRVIAGEQRIAEHFDNVSVLFADIVGFTPISAHMPPASLLDFMNFIFEHFDGIALRHGCERIKTMGDGYMAICGAPERHDDHALRLTSMALEMMQDIYLPDTIREHLPTDTVLHLRIGLHCGELTAGVVGTGKLSYDVYGDTVNTAARMEQHGEPGRIHVTESFKSALINSNLHFSERGVIEVKGKGQMKTWFVER